MKELKNTRLHGKLTKNHSIFWISAFSVSIEDNISSKKEKSLEVILRTSNDESDFHIKQYLKHIGDV